MPGTKMQRLRLTFSRGEEVKYISHLDLMRLWERALRRADLPLAYSQGFSPHPRLSLAAPLAIGVTSSAELMDIFLERLVSPHFIFKTLRGQLPKGIDLLEALDVGLRLPSLQSQVLCAGYRVNLGSDKTSDEVEAALRLLLAKESLSWQHSRDKEIRRYDLRALVADLWLLDWQLGECTLGMTLRCDSSGTGRPEQVAFALGFDQHPRYIHRTKLILSQQAR
ncbi:TIGR03936 family radical SAM-associated protein [Chloroflexota bacterium]